MSTFDCTCSESCGTDGYCCFIITDLYSPIRGVVVAAARVTGREVGHAVTPTHRVVLLHVTAAVRDTHARQVTAAALRPVKGNRYFMTTLVYKRILKVLSKMIHSKNK